jgi:enolase-phosphatase E1
LLDIEGTTTPISFVVDILFPFARERLDEYCSRESDFPGVARAIDLLREEHIREGVGVPSFGSGAPFARYLMDQDRKSTGLKALQGIIWESGYRSGELKSQIFDDVQAAMAGWRQSGIRLRIFSSGSVLAQKLLFAHTTHGNLCGLLEGYHDTTTGPKRESGSYLKIASEFELAPSEILFHSDVVEELDAASEAGMKTGWVVRPGNKESATENHPRLEDFRGLNV